MIPFNAELGLRLDERIFLGLQAEYGLADVRSCAADPGTCSLSTFRLGGEVQLHIGSVSTAHAWVGAGGGLQVLHVFASGDFGGTAEETHSYDLRGWFADLELGVEIPLTPVIRVGPWIQFSVGKGTGYDAGSLQGRFGIGIRLAFVV